MPTWLSGTQVVITKTHNGWVLSPELVTPIGQCLTFETWDAAISYLTANWSGQTDT